MFNNLFDNFPFPCIFRPDMAKQKDKYTQLADDLGALKIGDYLSRAINLEMRLAAYTASKFLGIKLRIREIPLQKGRFQVMRIA